MEIPGKTHQLQHLLANIEQKLGWGPGAEWSSRDFELVSEKIQQETGASLSVSTLKRVWGRVKSNSEATTQTLDILSQFAGYDHWRDYLQATEPEEKLSPTLRVRQFGPSSWVLKGLVFLLIGGLGYGIWWFLPTEGSWKNIPTNPSGEVLVEAVTVGMPATASLTYHLAESPVCEMRLRLPGAAQSEIPLSTSAGKVRATYYHPGYFKVLGFCEGRDETQAVVAVGTDAWTACVEKPGLYAPIYLSEEDWLEEEGEISFLPSVSSLINDPSQYVNLYLERVESDPKVSGTNFAFEAEVRLLEPERINPCNTITIRLHGTEESLAFGVASVGCTGDLHFILAGTSVIGTETDLSGFGTNTEAWVQLRVEGNGEKLRFFRDGEFILEHSLRHPLGKMGGVSIVFSGLGALRGGSFFPFQQKNTPTAIMQ